MAGPVANPKTCSAAHLLQQPVLTVQPLRSVQVVQTVRCANYKALNPVESPGMVGKNFPFDRRVEVLHRLERTVVPMVPAVSVVPIVFRPKISPARKTLARVRHLV